MESIPMNRALRALFLLPLFASLALMGGCASMNAESPWLNKSSVAELQANPARISEALLQGTNLDGLKLENVTIRNAAFIQTTGRNVALKNVIFENCRFINAAFTQAALENVTFKGGLMTCEADMHNAAKRTSFTSSVFRNVVLEGTVLENTRFDLRDSQITLKNLHSMVSQEPMITGPNIQLTLDGATLRFMVIAQVSGSSTLSARRCTFENAGFGESRFTSANFISCTTYGPPVYTPPAPEPARRGGRK